MANRRISELQELAGLDLVDQDLLTVVHVNEVDPTLKNRKLTISGTRQYLNTYYLQNTGGTISGALIVQGNLTVSGSTNFATATFTGVVTVGSLIAQSGVTVSGTISGNTITGSAIQGTNVNGVLGNFTTITGDIINVSSGNFLNRISGLTITGASGAFTSLTGQTITGTIVNVQTITGSGATFTTLTGNTAGFTTVTGATVTGTSGNFVSGVFTSSVSGLTVVGVSGTFTSLTGTTVTGTTANFTSGKFSTLVSGLTVTGTSGQFTTVTGVSGGFTIITGATVTGTIANFVTLSGTTVTGNAGQFTTLTGVDANFTNVTGVFVSGVTVKAATGVFTNLQFSSATVSGDLTVLGTGYFQSGVSVTGTISGITVTGTSGQFNSITGGSAGFTSVTGVTVTGTTANFVSGVFTSQVSGATVTGDTGQFTNITGASGTFTSRISGAIVTGNTAGFTTITGTTVTGTTANFVSGVFTTQISGVTVTGTTANFTSGNFIALSGTTTVVTSGVFSSGIATAPSVAIGSGTTYKPGIYSPGADQVAISTSGTGRLFIDSSGRLLAGTSTARSNFFGTTLSSVAQIEGTGGASGRGALSVINNDVSNNPPYVLLGRSGAATLGSNAVVVSGSRLGTLTFHGADGTSFIEAATVASEVDGTPGSNDMPGRLVFSTTADGAASPTERMRIDSSGRVGIGTTGPQGKLVISNSGAEGLEIYPAYSSGLNMQFHYNRSGAVFVDSQSRAATHQFYITNTESARIDSSGRLLVGTSSARTDIGSNQTAAIQTESTVNGLGYFSAFNQASIYGSIIALAKSRGTSVGSNTIVQSGDQIGGVYFYGADGVDTAPAAGIDCYVDGTPGSNDMPGRLVFSTTADGAASFTERMRLTSAGLLGLGTTSPSTTLDCKGNITLGSQNASAANVQPTTGSGTNIAGTHLTLRAGIPTGSGASGQVQIFPSTSSATGGTSPATNASKGLYLRQQITSWDNNPALFMLNAVFGSSASEGNRSGLGNDGTVVTIDGANNGSQSALEIVGSSNATNATQGFIRFFGSGSKNPYVTIGAFTPGTSYTSGNFFINTYNSGTESTVATFTNTGRVGIGTTSPTYKLHASGTTGIIKGDSAGCTFGNPSLSLTDSTHGVELLLTPINGLGAIGTYTNHPLAFYANNGERARIDSSGRVGIGTTSPGTSRAYIQVDDTNTVGLTINGINSSAGVSAFSNLKLTGNTPNNVTTHIGAEFVKSQSNTEAIRGYSADITGAYSTQTNFYAKLTKDLNAITAGYCYYADLATSGSGGAAYFAYFYNSTSSAERFSITNAGTTTLTSAASTAPFIAKIGSSEVSRIDSSGRLLVGTSTARTNLYGASANPTIQVEAAGMSGSLKSIISICNNSTIGAGPTFALMASGDNSVGAVTIVNTGHQLGIVDFLGTDGTKPISAASIMSYVDGTPGANDMPGRLVFSTTADGASSPTERMRINNAGYLKATSTGGYSGAGSTYHEMRTAANNSAIVVFSHDGTSGLQYGLNIGTTNDQNDTVRYFIQCIGGATERATIRSNGGLANYSANNVNLSDRNVKKDIAPAPGTWSCLKEWEIVNFRYKDQSDDVDLSMGVIAQQIAESCPEVITVFQEAKEAKEAVLDEEGNELEPAQELQHEKLGVKDQQMMWMAIKALQEAQLRIETLEAEVAALKVQ